MDNYFIELASEDERRVFLVSRSQGSVHDVNMIMEKNQTNFLPHPSLREAEKKEKSFSLTQPSKETGKISRSDSGYCFKHNNIFEKVNQKNGN